MRRSEVATLALASAALVVVLWPAMSAARAVPAVGGEDSGSGSGLYHRFFFPYHGPGRQLFIRGYHSPHHASLLHQHRQGHDQGSSDSLGSAELEDLFRRLLLESQFEAVDEQQRP